MSQPAPIRVPVEVKLDRGPSKKPASKSAPKSQESPPRWFRLAHQISVDGLLFTKALPEECEGPLAVTFSLPDGADKDEPLVLDGRVFEMAPPEQAPGDGEARHDEHDRPQRLGIRFLGVDDEVRDRIARYVEARLLE